MSENTRLVVICQGEEKQISETFLSLGAKIIMVYPINSRIEYIMDINPQKKKEIETQSFVKEVFEDHIRSISF